MKIFFKYWFPVLAWAAVIFLIASMPRDYLPDIILGQDILFHILEYLPLAWLLCRALNSCRIKPASRSMRLILVIALCLVYAVLDEFYQQFTPGRISSISDVIFDGMGIVIGSVIYRW